MIMLDTISSSFSASFLSRNHCSHSVLSKHNKNLNSESLVLYTLSILWITTSTFNRRFQNISSVLETVLFRIKSYLSSRSLTRNVARHSPNHTLTLGRPSRFYSQSSLVYSVHLPTSFPHPLLIITPMPMKHSSFYLSLLTLFQMQ